MDAIHFKDFANLNGIEQAMCIYCAFSFNATVPIQGWEF